MVAYIRGDLFAASQGVLAHACNCHGVWGGGIAATFKQKFPGAFAKYAAHCAQHSPKQLLGTCQLIDDNGRTIACLYTNDGNSMDEIANYTGLAVRDMFNQLPRETVVNMPRINAGIFGVPWDKTAGQLPDDKPINVYIV